jgi:glycosyltransferase involved in cell wall biosynthesis
MAQNKSIIKELHIFALASHGVGISGGDRIWIELARRWQKHFSIIVHTWEEGRQMGERQNLKENQESRIKSQALHFIIYPIPFCNLGFVICYLARIFRGIYIGLTLRLNNNSSTYLYNASEFWMDAFPCIILKMRYPKVRWIATWYQTAPNPLKGFSEKERSGNTYKLRALAYWLTQLPVNPLIKKYADKVIVNNEDEKKQFPKHSKSGDTIVMIGAVPLSEIGKWKLENKRSLLVHGGNSPKVYDAVFQGRFHAQKGVVELVDIWKQVVRLKPDAKLAMIGNGPLIEDIIRKIKGNKLDKNIKLFGFVFDGDEKYQIFAESKMVLHPAFYDSGGMATAEAMAFGIPAIGFDLKAYDSYYPKGMVKVKDEEEFAKTIVTLLDDSKRREKIGREAKELIEKSYSWDVRADEILHKIRKEADTGSSPA